MEKQFETPILFLIFNRADTAQKVFDQIRKIRPKYFFVAADGPRESVKEEKEKCEEVRDIIKQIDWDCDLRLLFRENNLGCGPAVSSAITWFFEQVDAGIILEDDCYPDLSFFPYCAELLEKYAATDTVKLIGGNNYHLNAVKYDGSYIFSNYAHIWGWASWKRVWKDYDFEVNDFEESFKTGKLDHVFQTNFEKNYWRKKYRQFLLNPTGTWDYQLLYFIWMNKGVSITPAMNLVKNIGLDNNSTHKFLKDPIKSMPINTMPFPLKHPEMVVNRIADYHTYLNFFSHHPKRVLRLIKENGIGNIIRYISKQELKP